MPKDFVYRALVSASQILYFSWSLSFCCNFFEEIYLNQFILKNTSIESSLTMQLDP